MRNRLFLLVLGLLLPCVSSAQEPGVLLGRILDANGEPLPGANVVLPALDRGAAADVDGTYRIADLPAGTYQATARFVGFRGSTLPVTIEAGAETEQDFTLTEDLLQLDEVVVTGTGGSVERRKLSANVDVLDTRDIEQVPVTSVDQLLQGRVPGASVRLQSAQPGQGALINFRGVTSVFGSQTPTIYVDGVRVDNSSSTSFSLGGETTSALSELLINDIERIEITKGGAASTLYGSDAASGVIQIFTRRGVAGAPRVTFRTEQGFDLPTTQFLQDTQFSFEDVVTNPESVDFGRGDFLQDEFLSTGYFQNYYVGASGGREDLTFNVSGRVQHAEGVQPSNENTIYALRGNLQAQALPQLRVGFSGSFTRSNFSRLNNGTAIADPLTSFEVGDAFFFTGASDFDEALRRFLLPNIEEGVNRFIASSSATYTPSPLFTTALTIGIDTRANEQRVVEPSEFDIISGNDGGEITRFTRDFTAVTLDYTGTIHYPREGPVTSSFTFGAQGFREETSIGESFGESILPGSEDLGQTGIITADERRIEVFSGGFFFREQLGFFDRLFFDAGLRLDGNSAFGEDVGLQAYPSVGLAYTLSDEPFWAESFGRTWTDLKLRAAYGQTGKFPDPFVRDFSFSAISFRDESAARFDFVGNDDLEPEKTATLEAGFDASLLDNRLGLSFTYYTSTTNDALFFVPEQPVTGQEDQLRNVGTIENQGVELSADAQLLNTPRVQWSFGLSYSWFENEVTDMGEGPDRAPDFNLGGRDEAAQQRVAEGHPVGEWRATTPFDSNNDGLLDSTRFAFTGTTPYPTQTGSFSTTLTLFERLSFFALADWALGAEIFDWGSHWAAFNGLVRAERPVQFDLEGNELGLFTTTTAGSALLLDGDYLKLREVSLRYSIPQPQIERFGLTAASVFVTGRNLLTWAAQDLVDPEITGVSGANVADAGEGTDGLLLGGEQSVTLSPPRQIRLGIEVSF